MAWQFAQISTGCANLHTLSQDADGRVLVCDQSPQDRATGLRAGDFLVFVSNDERHCEESFEMRLPSGPAAHR